MKKRLLLVLLVVPLLSGCRYELVTGLSEDGGRVYRLDRFTGTLTVVDDGALKTVSDVESDASDLPSSEARTLAGTGAKIKFDGKWRNGKLFYRVNLSPYSKLKSARDSNGTVWVDLLDSDDYVVDTINVSLSGMTQVVDAKGQPQALEFVGRKQMSRSDFNAMSSWGPRWAF
ncbi:hypothetical protein [Deinococcus yavapaiensis]|uniref:Lipoprotein n=1 Tax=Deinococcus yavapaiensis KR-236 TaxID=694435 RepID=A0A318SJ57_9DEIO|nr:hypothetical protein [Deinococcus yavapaiensis]PYE51963.1 hypothetical protein DES52_1139 [Deinococcus yavapaiensis KR-236]